MWSEVVIVYGMVHLNDAQEHFITIACCMSICNSCLFVSYMSKLEKNCYEICLMYLLVPRVDGCKASTWSIMLGVIVIFSYGEPFFGGET